MLKQGFGAMVDDDEKPEHPDEPRYVQSTPRLYTSNLMQGRKEIIIVHAGAEYRLRITSQNKLILTK